MNRATLTEQVLLITYIYIEHLSRRQVHRLCQKIIGDITAQQKMLPVGIPENPAASPLGEARIHGQPEQAIVPDADSFGIAEQLRLTEPDWLMRLGLKCTHRKE